MHNQELQDAIGYNSNLSETPEPKPAAQASFHGRRQTATGQASVVKVSYAEFLEQQMPGSDRRKERQKYKGAADFGKRWGRRRGLILF